MNGLISAFHVAVRRQHTLSPPVPSAGPPLANYAGDGVHVTGAPGDASRVFVAEGAGTTPDGVPESGIIGCGALHVMWDDIAEVRTLAVRPDHLHTGVGSAILDDLLTRARALDLRRVFCLTFEVDFFTRHGFHPIEGTPVGVDAFTEMVRSHDDGVAEFLDLARAKPNTLGNTRMLLEL